MTPTWRNQNQPAAKYSPAIIITDTRVTGDGRHLIAELSDGAIRILPAEKLTAQPWKGSNNGHHEI